MKKANLIDKWWRGLPPAGSRTVRLLCDAAEQHGVRLYLAGGPVRDLLLSLPSLDADIAVEGDMSPLLAELRDVRIVRHTRFLTATVRTEGFALDLATARAETYRHPGALPSVRTATMREDLLRRDFTINAMALALTGRERGELLDPAGGEHDLRQRTLRVLHDDSFRDDATRILRAVRYAARFGFRIEQRTAKLLRSHLPYLHTISGARIHHEISRTLAEIEPEGILLRLDELGALEAVHPALSFGRERAEGYRSLRQLHCPLLHPAYWVVLAWNATESDTRPVVARLALTKAQAQCVASLPRLRELEPDLAGRSLSASRLHEMLAPYPLSSVWALAVMTLLRLTRERCLEYLTRLRHVRTALSGHDVLALGVPPGPQVGEALRRLKVARLNGEVTSRRQEEAFVRALLQASAPSAQRG